MTLREEILGTVTSLVREVIGEDWARDVAVGFETSFGRDLELESIEFVALAEKLQEQYGTKVDFVSWLSGKEIDEIIALTVGELVEFIAQCLSPSSTA